MWFMALLNYWKRGSMNLKTVPKFKNWREKAEQKRWKRQPVLEKIRKTEKPRRKKYHQISVKYYKKKSGLLFKY
jgi:hypothetical protein